MAREVIGDACAYIKTPGMEKASYPRIGSAMRDGERLSIKIDTLPLPNSGWQGWINIFPKEQREQPKAKPKSSNPYDDFEDDIPF